MREASQTQKLYDHSGAKKSVVWKYLGFIKAKDGPATKTKLEMTKATYKLCLNHTITINMFSYLNNDHLSGNNNYNKNIFS